MGNIDKKTIASFDIQYLRFLDENSKPTQNFPDFANDPGTLLSLYKKMALTRALDNKAINLQRTGKMGTYPSTQGQEAVGVGTGSALNKDDVYCPYYRESGALLQRGVSMTEILAIWGGDERGNLFKHAQQDFPTCVPIATQCLHAAGVAYAMKYRKEKRAVVTSIGEGGTSKGDFYEAMNFAGVHHLPVVFVVNNNQWAISVPRDIQTGAKTIAQKAIAAGIEGIQVDGNDVIAVRKAVLDALEKARNGKGPTLIEAITYRLCDHTTADDASRYQPPEEVKAAWKIEPIARLAHYLESQGLWSKEKETELQQQCSAEVEKAVQSYLAIPKDKPEAMFDSLYAELPEALLDQRDEAGGKQ
jgi:2-oxoisovalerate dehydrogenase E1 component alpha subunit